MKAVLVLAGLVALTLGAYVPSHENYKYKEVDATFVEHQKKVLWLFDNVKQLNHDAEWYKIGKEYSIEANIEHYTKKEVVEHFLTMRKTGFLPKGFVFSVFYDRLREEAIALFNLFYYAKDFETFYKTAAWAKVYLNEYQFYYAYYIALIHRPETTGFVFPAPYEVYPEMFINQRVFDLIHRIKMQDGMLETDIAYQHGIVKENENFIFYANYSNALTYPNDEERLSYFYEDVGLNSYYYYFHSMMPFWWNANTFGPMKERRGEMYYFFYQQMLARYYLERLSNGLGEIPEFSWYEPIKTGYYPFMTTNQVPFAQRSNFYNVHMSENYEEIRFLDTYEKSFLQFLQKGHFKAYNRDVDFHNSKSINFVGNYWQANADLFNEDYVKDYHRGYETVARKVLGGAPEPMNKYSFLPSALDFYQTSMRDPVFYQMYNKIFDYTTQYKKYLVPYTQNNLHFVGVKINDVKVDKLVTFFDFFEFNATNSVSYGVHEKSFPHSFLIRQPRLNHKPFSVDVEVKSETATDAVIKIFLGPKYDSNGFPIALEDNWMNFVELDWFHKKLVPGQNKIVRKSEDFAYWKEDSLPLTEIWKKLGENKVSLDMSEDYDSMPKRLMLPKGTHGGFPYQLFVFVYPYSPVSKEVSEIKMFDLILDNKPFGYPLDRPLNEFWFKQPNMFFEDVMVYHEGEQHHYKYSTPGFKPTHLNA